MSHVIALAFLPPLLVFGVYHLSLWINLLGIRTMAFWRRTALASALSHIILSVGIFLFLYIDFRINGGIADPGLAFDAFLFNRSLFWSLIAVFDTVGMIVLLGVFGSLDRLTIGLDYSVPLTVGIILIVGTLQWYWLGGGIGAAFERLWSGLKGPEEEDPGRWAGP